MVGRSYPIDRAESIGIEFGGNDVIRSGGGEDIVIAGTGNDWVDSSGDADMGPSRSRFGIR